MKNLVPERISRQRSEQLIALAGQLYTAYIARQQGRREQVIIEEEVTMNRKKYYAGLSSNYLKVLIESSAALKIGSMHDVTLHPAADGNVVGTLV